MVVRAGSDEGATRARRKRRAGEPQLRHEDGRSCEDDEHVRSRPADRVTAGARALDTGRLAGDPPARRPPRGRHWTAGLSGGGRRSCVVDGGVGPLSSASRRQPVSRRATGKGTPEANAPGGDGRWGACGSRSACRSCTAWWCKRRRGGTDLIVFSCSERLATGQFHLASARGHLPVFCPARVSGCLPRAFRWSSPPRPFITSSVLLGLCIPASVGPPGMCRRVGPRSSRRRARPHGSVGPPDMFAASGLVRRLAQLAHHMGGSGRRTFRRPAAPPRTGVGLRLFTVPRSSAIARECRAAGHVRRARRLHALAPEATARAPSNTAGRPDAHALAPEQQLARRATGWTARGIGRPLRCSGSTSRPPCTSDR